MTTTARGEKIVVSWDPESGIRTEDLQNALAEQGIEGGYLNVARHSAGGLFLVWSPRWFDEAEAAAAVREILASVAKAKKARKK